MTLKQLMRFVFVAGSALLMATASAQEKMKIEVSGVGGNLIPVTVAGFSHDTGASKISEIIKLDLARTGAFRLIGTDQTLDVNSDVNYQQWSSAGANALATGTVQNRADGKLEVLYRLYDTQKKSELSYLRVSADPSQQRLLAHKIADDIYKKLTGFRGTFSTKMAYVVKSKGYYRLEISDNDGVNPRLALKSKEPIISPSWSPDGRRVAYVSFEEKKPVVYIQELATGKRYQVANYKGNNSAPSWSPDGSRLAVALSRDGYTQVYTVGADGKNLVKLTHDRCINTEPQFSADGQSIYFTSDRSGGPQIYRMPASGGSATRVTFHGNYNISPRLSPDGKSLAYISRRGGFQLYLLDLASGQETRLSSSTSDESPSFSPNGQYIMYATGAGRLAVVSIDGRVRQNVTIKSSDIREPSWGPFLN